jgi:hypothetical protein
LGSVLSFAYITKDLRRDGVKEPVIAVEKDCQGVVMTLLQVFEEVIIV